MSVWKMNNLVGQIIGRSANYLFLYAKISLFKKVWHHVPSKIPFNKKYGEASIIRDVTCLEECGHIFVIKMFLLHFVFLEHILLWFGLKGKR